MANTVFDLAWINAQLNNTDSSKRFYPLATSGGMRNFSSERADAIMQTFDAGGVAFIRDSTRTNKFILIGDAASMRYNGILNDFRCKPFGFFIVDNQQNIGGIISSSTGNCGTCNCNTGNSNTGVACSPEMSLPYNLIKVPLYANDGTRNGIALTDDVDPVMLYPIPVDEQSFYAKSMWNNGKDTVLANAVTFDFAPDFKDAAISIIPCSSFVGWFPSMIRGLVDVCPVFSSIEQTTFTVQVQTLDGSAVQKTLAQGWVIGDFSLYNTTDSASVTITRVTESTTTNGEYVFVIPSQTLGDELLLTATKTGFDTTCFARTAFAIPNS